MTCHDSWWAPRSIPHHPSRRLSTLLAASAFLRPKRPSASSKTRIASMERACGSLTSSSHPEGLGKSMGNPLKITIDMEVLIGKSWKEMGNVHNFPKLCLFTGGYLICPGLQLFHLFCACDTQKSKRFAIWYSSHPWNDSEHADPHRMPVRIWGLAKYKHWNILKCWEVVLIASSER